MAFCSRFIKATLSLHSHEDPHKILKFSSGFKTTFFRGLVIVWVLNDTLIRSFGHVFSKIPSHFLKKNMKPHWFIHQIFTKHRYVPSTVKNAGEAISSSWLPTGPKELEICFSRVQVDALQGLSSSPSWQVDEPLNPTQDLNVLILQRRERGTFTAPSQVWICKGNSPEMGSSPSWYRQLSSWPLPYLLRQRPTTVWAAGVLQCGGQAENGWLQGWAHKRDQTEAIAAKRGGFW